MLRLPWALAICVLFSAVQATFELGYGDDRDLLSFVTRPDLRAPRFHVTRHFPDDIAPGFWFVAPYVQIIQERFPRSYLQPCQSGPAIYDGNGDLVWSGACLVRNQNTCDFRVFVANGTEYLSAILSFWPGVDGVGQAIVMDNAMQITSRHQSPPALPPFNMHEFKIDPTGRIALHIVQKTELTELTDIEDTEFGAGLVAKTGVREFDLLTDETLFEWWADEHVPLNHSHAPVASLAGPFPEGWDWIHLNAVDKDSAGDYLVTGRYTDAIYKVSGRNGSLMWTLGGPGSDFALEGFNMFAPHDGKFLKREGNKEFVTLLDNGADHHMTAANHSTAYVIELDHVTKIATPVGVWRRPDGRVSDKRGNFQLLPNGNAFVGWSDGCYISEHSPDGRVLMEARFVSRRFVSYRAYKFSFTSRPSESPVMKAFAYGDRAEDSMSVYYVSWNGATDVAAWRFYDAGSNAEIGIKNKTGFETMYAQSRQISGFVYVEALAIDGTSLGKSQVVMTETPLEWEQASVIFEATLTKEETWRQDKTETDSANHEKLTSDQKDEL